MTLEQYRTMHRLTYGQLAQLIGFSGTRLVRLYAAGERFPTPLMLRNIREATNGAVTADDFVNQCAPREERK